MKPPARKYCYLFYLLFSLTCTQLHTQPFSSRLYTIEDGLPDNYIFGINQDSFGYLWISTTNGISRFDGKQFKNYGLTNGLPSLQVDQIYEDKLHRLWIGTRRGVAEMKGDSCYTYPADDGHIIKFVSGFRENENGELFVLTDKGMYKFGKGVWEKMNIWPGFENKGINGMVTIKNGTIINFENRQIVWKKKNGEQQLLASYNTSTPYFNSIRQDQDNVYIGTYHGLFKIQGEAWTNLYPDSLNKRYTYGFFIDSRKRFWFSTKDDGIFVISQQEEKTSYYRIPLAFNLVSNFFEDKEGNIWAACLTGLLKIIPEPYHSFQLPQFKELGKIVMIAALPGNQLLLSGSSGKLILLQLKSNSKNVNDLAIINTYQLYPGDFVDQYTFDEYDRTWLVTRNAGLYRLDKNAMTDLTSLVPKSQAFVLRDLVYNKTTKRLYLCADSVLIAGDETKVDTLFENGSRRFIPLPTRCVLAKDGSLLVQTLNDGLYRIDTNGSFESLNKKLGMLNDPAGIAFRKDMQDDSWLSYHGKGIARYFRNMDGTTGLTDHLSEKEGLQTNAVYDFRFNNNNQMWVITKKGVGIFQKNETGKWLSDRIAVNTDLNTADLFFAKLAVTTDGNTWINAPDRLLRFDKKEKITLPPSPGVVIEEVLLFNKPTDWKTITDSVSGYRQFPVDPVLKYNQNSLSITFNAIQYNIEGPGEYSYQLAPSDKGWSEPSTSNTISFYRLSPGIYRFRVKARLRGFTWSEPAEFTFRITKPFWETWWFRILVVLSASAVLIILFRSRINNLKKKAAIESQIRELEMNAFKAQMNPHFIHNALNSIQSLILNDKSSLASHYISKFAKLLRQVLENADKDLIGLDKELYSLQLYVDLEKLRLNMDIEYKEQIDEHTIVSGIKIPPLILQPFVENALWHGLSQKKGNRKLTVGISEEDNRIICTITDNGVGRRKAAEQYSQLPEGHLSKAVNITRQRLKDFNQFADTESIRFIDLEDNGVPSGTTVVILIRKVM